MNEDTWTRSVDRFYNAEQLDCNDDSYTYTGWCGNEEAAVSSRISSVITGGRKSCTGTGFKITLDGFTNSVDGTVLAAGDYYADEYRIEFRFNYSGWNIRKYMPNTIGTNASPFKVAPWCDIYDIVESPTIVNSMAKAVTYVYYVKSLLNGRSIKKWFPCTPEQARIGITYTPAQNANNCPNPCYPLSVNRYTTPMEAK